jgi:hypothetical protein
MQFRTTRWILIIVCAVLVIDGGRAWAQSKKNLKLAFVTNNASDF